MRTNEDWLKGEIEYADNVSKHYPERREHVFVAVLTARLINRDPALGRAEAGPRQPQQTDTSRGGRESLTASELFAQLRPELDTDKVLDAAYFLDSVRRVEAFSADELKGLLLEAKVAPPKNASLAALRNSQKGLMAQRGKDGKKISWMITQTGIEAVKQRLQQTGSSIQE